MTGHQTILEGERTKMNIIAWKSHTLKRKTISTLSAESQALIEASSVAVHQLQRGSVFSFVKHGIPNSCGKMQTGLGLSEQSHIH